MDIVKFVGQPGCVKEIFDRTVTINPPLDIHDMNSGTGSAKMDIASAEVEIVFTVPTIKRD